MRQNETYRGLRGKQLKVAEMLANPDIHKKKEEMAEEAGVSRATLYRWLSDPRFNSEVEKLINNYTDGELAMAWKCLLARMPVDTAAVKLYFELKGRYSQHVDAQVTNNNPYEGLTTEQLEKLAANDTA